MLSVRITVLRGLRLIEEPIDHNYLLDTDIPQIRLLYNEDMLHGHYTPICKYGETTMLVLRHAFMMSVLVRCHLYMFVSVFSQSRRGNNSSRPDWREVTGIMWTWMIKFQEFGLHQLRQLNHSQGTHLRKRKRWKVSSMHFRCYQVITVEIVSMLRRC